ncbi:MAG: DUF5011 domain-containing protein [Candidatus Hydrogenedens sp.]|nr:DUF5011 domain-containing protein [Candidatus Hydrogenedens sp.]
MRSQGIRAFSAAIAAFAAALPGGAWSATLPLSIDLKLPAGQEGTPFARYAPVAQDGMGAGNDNVAAADFNGDGYDDLAIGLSRYSTVDAPGSSRGRVVVVFGGPKNTGGTLGDSGLLSIECVDNNAEFGYAVAAGDVTGDGLPELIVGAPGARSVRGVVVVLENADVDEPGTLQVSTDATDPLNGESRYVGGAEGDQLGYAIACGNTNSDAPLEMVFGAPGVTVNAVPSSGTVYTVFPGNLSLGMTLEVTSEPERFELLGPSGSRMGSSVVIGDFDGDGYEDVACGAPDASTAFIIYSVNPGPNTIDAGDSGSFGSMTRLFGIDSIGYALDSGDADADGFEDLLIGLPLYAPTVELEQAGGALLFEGRANLLGAAFDLTMNNLSGFRIIKGGLAGARLGTSVSLGDIDGDGYDDLVMGAAFADAPEPDGGYYGLVQALTAPDLLSGFREFELEFLNADVSVYGRTNLDLLGAAVMAKGDLDGDGKADLVMTAPFSNNADESGAGYAHVLYGDGTSTIAAATLAQGSGQTQLDPVGGDLSPVLRTRLKYLSGSGGKTTVALSRLTGALSNLGNGEGTNIAPVYWEVTTDRTTWNTAVLEFAYTPAEALNLNEDLFAIYQAPAADGPWTRVDGQTLDTTSRSIQLSTNALGFFALISEAPTLTLIGNDILEVECTEEFSDPGASAISATGASLNGDVVVSGGVVDTSAVSEFTLYYDVQDGMGNPAVTLSRLVRVKDTLPPLLSYNGSEFMYVECGDSLVLPTVTAYDDCTGDLTDQIVQSGDLPDFGTAGNYGLSFDVSDASGNVADPLTYQVIVTDTSAPEIVLNGPEAVTLQCRDTYTDEGAVATDYCEGDITFKMETNGLDTVDTSVAGVYYIQYYVEDSAGYYAQKYRTVTVEGTCGTPGTFDDCPSETIIVQPPDDGSGTGAAQESEDGGTLVFENFRLNPSEPVGSLTWWGYGADAQGNACTRTPNVFRIRFYRGISLIGGIAPSTEVGSFTMTPLTTDTGFTDSEGHPILRYTAVFDPPVDFGPDTQFSNQFVNITGMFTPDCAFHWYHSPVGDGIFRTGTDSTNTVAQQSGDLAMCIGPYTPTAEGEGQQEGVAEGEGAPEGTPEGVAEGTEEGQPEGTVEGTPEGAIDGEGQSDGEPPAESHSADQDGNGKITLAELLRVVQLYNLISYGCGGNSEDGFAPYSADQSCAPHASDYAPQNWIISLNELVRLIQFFNADGYTWCPQEEDGYCPAL